MRANSKPFGRLPQAAAAVCLLAYLQAAGFLPCLLAFGAWLEGSHAVWLGGGPERLTIILHHRRGRLARTADAAKPPHRHGIASKIFCLLATTAPGPLADHVASFAINSACVKAAGELKVPSAQPGCAVSFAAHGHFSARSPPASARPVPFDSTVLPPPSLRALRVTVLLV